MLGQTMHATAPLVSLVKIVKRTLGLVLLGIRAKMAANVGT